MKLLDKLKGLLRGHEKQVKTGIDKVSDTVEKRVGDKNVADKAKDAVDKLAKP